MKVLYAIPPLLIVLSTGFNNIQPAKMPALLQDVSKPCSVGWIGEDQRIDE